MKLVNVSVGQMQVFVTTKKDGIMINGDVNTKKELIEEYMIKDLFGILVIVNVINYVILGVFRL